MKDLHLANNGKVASDPNETREAYVARMEAEGFTVIYPAANELQIDIDNPAHYEAFERSWPILFRDVEASVVVDRPSKSGSPGRHIVIQLPFEIDTWQRIALQASLGSDPVRELLSCLRALNDDAHPTLLVDKLEDNNDAKAQGDNGSNNPS